MARASSQPVVDRLLDPVARSFTPAVAREIIKVRADSKTAARVAALAEKCNQGTLTDAERAEYEAAVAVGNFIAILQAKARRMLKSSSRA